MNVTMKLADRHCARWPKGKPPFTVAEASAAMQELPGWSLAEGATRLTRRFRFADFRAAMRFVAALADLPTPRTTTQSSRSAGTRSR